MQMNVLVIKGRLFNNVQTNVRGYVILYNEQVLCEDYVCAPAPCLIDIPTSTDMDIFVYLFVHICRYMYSTHTSHISSFPNCSLEQYTRTNACCLCYNKLADNFFSRHTIKLLLRIYTKKIIFCNVVFKFYFALKKLDFLLLQTMN
jgi:hypothetical protein